MITLAALTDAAGYSPLPIGVPNDPALSGLTLTGQGLVFGPTAIDFSNAVSFTIQ